MGIVVGMAGLAEAAEAYSLMIGYAGLVLLGLVTTVGLIARSRVISGMALTLAFVLTLLFAPWEAFRSIQSSDPDVHSWVVAWREFARWWGFATIASIAASIPALCLPNKAGLQQNEQVAEGSAGE